MTENEQVQLTADEVRQYREEGYVKGFRIFDDSEAEALRQQYPNFATRRRTGARLRTESLGSTTRRLHHALL